MPPASSYRELTVCSWNVDGLRDPIWAWLKKYLMEHKPHILCLNETKRTEAALQVLFAQIRQEYEAVINSHNPARYHGVAVLVRKDVPYRVLECGASSSDASTSTTASGDSVWQMSCPPRSDTKSNNGKCGRVIALEILGKFHLVATYSPNAGVDRKQPLKNLSYRLQKWDKSLFAALQKLRLSKPTLWIGDINVAPDVVDVSHPKQMCRWAGFTPEERASFSSFVKEYSWVDIWRHQHPKSVAYTYRGKPDKWSASYGMRLDNCIVSADLKDAITDSFMVADCSAATDHIPFGVRVKLPTEKPTKQTPT